MAPCNRYGNTTSNSYVGRVQPIYTRGIDRGCVSDLLPDMLKPAFPAKSDLPPTFFVAKNKDRLPKITFRFLLFFSFAAKSLICCQELDLLQVSAYLAANH